MKILVVFTIAIFALACADITPYQKEILNFRKEKDFYLKNMPDSPIPDSLKPLLKGLNYYPIDEQWKLKVLFVPDSTHSELAGYLQFSFRNQKYQLTVFWDDTSNKNMLFLPFKDLTSGKSTYGGGRYLNIPFSGNSEMILDFNYSYHPYCVYNPSYVCKKVPQENFLNFEVLAGEKLPFLSD